MNMHTNLQLRRWLAIGVTLGTLAISTLTSGTAVGAANPNDRFSARDTTSFPRDDPRDRDNVSNAALFPSTPTTTTFIPVPSATLNPLVGPPVFLDPAQFVARETDPSLPGSFQIDHSVDRSGK